MGAYCGGNERALAPRDYHKLGGDVITCVAQSMLGRNKPIKTYYYMGNTLIT